MCGKATLTTARAAYNRLPYGLKLQQALYRKREEARDTPAADREGHRSAARPRVNAGVGEQDRDRS
jgi:hypothetical protein